MKRNLSLLLLLALWATAQAAIVLPEIIGRQELPIVFNLNIGHAIPRCIIPFGVEAEVNAEEQIIRFAP